VKTISFDLQNMRATGSMGREEGPVIVSLRPRFEVAAFDMPCLPNTAGLSFTSLRPRPYSMIVL
jgi:hypothetical protein